MYKKSTNDIGLNNIAYLELAAENGIIYSVNKLTELKEASL